MTGEIPLGTYLFQRLHDMGAQHIFGVPGDFNLKLLDHVYNVKGLEWIGTCNELNGAYAADGYARESGVPGVMVTTYGVGELSALNGVSGASAENVPLIHIVGQSPRFAQDEQILLHHSPAPHGLRPNDHSAYEKASAPLCCTMEKLWDPRKAPEQIDDLISQVLRNKEPATLFVPIDIVGMPVSSANLGKPFNTNVSVHPDTDRVVDAIVDAFQQSKRPVVLNDAFAARFNLKKETHAILDRTGAYGYVTFLGRSSIDETHPHFGGVYNGHVSFAGIPKAVEEDSDFILNIGAHVSDFNSGAMSRDISDDKLIIVHAFYARVFGKNYDGVHFKHVLERVLDRLPLKPQASVDQSKPKTHFPEPIYSGPITQLGLPHVITHLLRPEDTLIAETGTYQYGSRATKLPADALYFAQYYYSSIGFALPAAFGSALGKKLTSKQNKRIRLVEGDGSSMMTIQEMASMVRFKLPITIFLINNTGYSIERCIWGPEQGYNDIPPNWQWTKLLEVFGGQKEDIENYKVETFEEFWELAKNEKFVNSNKTQLVEVIMDKYDYPLTLRESTVVGAGWSTYKVGEWEEKTGLK